MKKHNRLNQYSFVFMLSIVLFYCLSCNFNKKPKTTITPKEQAAILISRSIQQTGKLVPPDQLTKDFLNKCFVPPKIRPEFVRIYKLVKRKWHKVHDQYKNSRSVIYFLLIKHLASDLAEPYDYNAVINHAVAENPMYTAFSMLMEELPDLSKIGNELYIKQLAKSLGASEKDIYEGIWYYIQTTEYQIAREVALMVNTNVADTQSSNPDFYFQNVLLPFLTYTSMSLVIRASIEKAIFDRFDEVFVTKKVPKLKNVLRDFTIAFRQHLLGDSFHVKYINNLNQALMRFGYRIYIRRNTFIGYKLLDYAIPIRKKGVGDVIFLKKVSISISTNFLGLSMRSENDVVLTMDNFIEYADDILYTIENGKPLYSFAKRRIGKFWDQLNMGITPQKADSIYAKLTAKEFKNMSQEEIINRVIKKIAVHEVKHKWDEQERKGKEEDSWYNVDSETSAHIAEILYGGIPYSSLLAFIDRYQRFYTNIEIVEVRKKLKTIIVTCWNLAQKVADNEIDAAQVKQEVKKIYNKYTLLEGEGNLPGINRYENEIIEPCFNDLPTLKVDKILSKYEQEKLAGS